MTQNEVNACESYWTNFYSPLPTIDLLDRLTKHVSCYKAAPTFRKSLTLGVLAGLICERDLNLADHVLKILPEKDLH